MAGGDRIEPADALDASWNLRRATAIFAGAFLLFAMLPSRNWNYADDSLSWSLRIATANGLINSHHLFLNGLHEFYTWLTRAFGANADPTRLFSIYSAFCGALGLMHLDALLRLAGLRRVALASTLICAFSAGYWCYSNVGDVYVPATAFLIAGLYWFCRGALPRSRRARCGAAAALSFILMIFHHQAYAVFILGLLPGALVLRGGSKDRLLYPIAVVAAVGTLALAAYFAVYVSSQSRDSFGGFVSGYATHFRARPDQKRISAGALLNAAAGGMRATISTNFIYRDENVGRRIQQRYPYRNVYPYPYLVRKFTPIRIGLIVAGLSLAIGFGAPLLARGLWAAFRERGFLACALIAAVPQALFFLWWEGISDEFWIWTMPIVAFTIATGAAAFRRRGPALAFACASGLFVCTLLDAVLPYLDSANDIDAVNLSFLDRVDSRDLVVGFDTIQNSSRINLARARRGFGYFSLVDRAFGWSAADERDLDQELQQVAGRGGRVFVSPYVLHPPLSSLHFIRLTSPRFDDQRRQVLDKLSSLDAARVEWVPLGATVRGYFLEDSSGTVSFRSGIGPLSLAH